MAPTIEYPALAQLNCATDLVTPLVIEVAVPLSKPLIGTVKVGQGKGAHVGLVVQKEVGRQVADGRPNREYPAEQLNNTMEEVTPLVIGVAVSLRKPLLGMAKVGQGRGAQAGEPLQLPSTQRNADWLEYPAMQTG